MKTPFHIIIPARFNSTRFPGKLLMLLNGVTIIEHVYRQALKAKPESITIATDNDLIAKAAHGFGAKVVITSERHPTGTDRIAEVIAAGDFAPQDIIVNVQGDEPFIPPQLIIQVAQSLMNTKAPMATLCWPIEDLEQLNNPNVVKVVRTRDDHALYFSRSPIPAHRDEPKSISNAYRHIGLYAYRASFLMEYVSFPVCALETDEALEQLRVLWSGAAIKVETACVLPLQDINTLEDLERARGSV
jgi:3-deoxy-manno-octulosonate cytidylyltransferase (CMP-KDO synthetase)